MRPGRVSSLRERRLREPVKQATRFQHSSSEDMFEAICSSERMCVCMCEKETFASCRNRRGVLADAANADKSSMKSESSFSLCIGNWAVHNLSRGRTCRDRDRYAVSVSSLRSLVFMSRRKLTLSIRNCFVELVSQQTRKPANKLKCRSKYLIKARQTIARIPNAHSALAGVNSHYGVASFRRFFLIF